MNLPNKFPMTDQEITLIGDRLKGVASYLGMGTAGPRRDLTKTYDALLWMIGKWESWKNEKQVATAERDVLRTYLTQTETVLAGYASGNWDGGAAANQLMSNLPQIP